MRNKDSDQGFEGENTVQPTNMSLRSNKRAWKTTRKIELGWIHTVKDNDQGTSTLSAVVSTAAVQIIDLTSLCDTSEVIDRWAVFR